MDTIHISDLVFSGKHGVYENERRRKQKFRIDLTLHLDLAPAGKTDSFSDTVDYHELRKLVRQVVVQTSSFLIEKIAQDIAEAILKKGQVDAVNVTVQKVSIWKNGTPGVTVTRKRVLK